MISGRAGSCLARAMRWCLGRHKIRARLSAQPRASSATRPPFASAAAGVLALLASTVRAGLLGLFGSASYALAAALLPLYGPIIWLELFVVHRRHRPAPRSRRGAVRRSPFIPCSVTSAASSVRSPSGGFSTSAVEWHPQRGQRLFLSSHCFRSSPSPCLPLCGRKSSPATVDRYDGQKSPVRQRDARQPSSASTRRMSADASTACIRRAPGRLARCASWRRLRHFRPLGLHAASERVHQVDDVLR